MKKKKIAVIAPDAIKLPLYDTCPVEKYENGAIYSSYEKCVCETSLGIRARNIAEELSKIKNYSVTVFLPDLNFPGREYIDFSKIDYNITSYNWKAAQWEWSEELDRKLKHYDYVIIQTTTGVGFKNCTVLPGHIKVIVDGWITFHIDYALSLISIDKRIQKKLSWEKCIPQYEDLLKRANCVLYAHESQLNFYEGVFFAINKLNWRAYKFSPLLKIPYGVSPHKKIKKKVNSTKLKLLWFGPIYPWYSIEPLLKIIKEFNNISLDFVAVQHPRYKKLYNTKYKKILENYENYVTYSEEYVFDIEELFSKYDAGIVISNNWVDEKYSSRCRLIDMMSCGLPVITNKNNPLYQEYDVYKSAIYPVTSYTLESDLYSLHSNKQLLEITDEVFESIHDMYAWDKVIKPLIDYINSL